MSLVTFKALQQMGGLGNQLFQMAATIGYAKDHGKDFIFPRWSYQDYIPIAIGEVSEPCADLSEQWIRYTNLPHVEGNANIHGHLFSTKYFRRHIGFLLNYFKLTEKWEKYISLKYGELLKQDTCSIHVRRGNYLEPEQLTNQGLMGMDYYNKAGEIMGSSKTYLVFSDDIAWCKENFVGGNLHFIEGEADIIDLFLMSKCKNNIIGNSTFSYWAATLNQNPGHKVVAPRQWFVNTEGWPDLYGDGWMII